MARELAIRPEQLRGWKKQLVGHGAVALPVRAERRLSEIAPRELGPMEDGEG